MTPRKAVRILTPTPEELQALYDLPSETSELERPAETKPAITDEADQIPSSEGSFRSLEDLEGASLEQCYNEVVRAIDVLFEAAGNGSEIATRSLHTLAGSAMLTRRHFA